MRSANTAYTARDPPKPAAHLASGGVYREKIEHHQRRNPNLRYPDWKVPKTRKDHICRGRLKLIAFNDNGTPESPQDLDIKELRDHLRARELADQSPLMMKPNGATAAPNLNATKPPARRNLYLLEGLNPEYVEEIGSYFNIDPAFFSRHKRTALWEGRQQGGNTGKLASADNPERSSMLEFPEILYFGDQPSSSMRNPDDNRHIDVSHKPNGLQSELDRVGNMHRKASWWSKPGQNNRDWDVVMLLDPPLPKHAGAGDKFTVLVGNSSSAKPVPMRVELYQGGYLDFEGFEQLTPVQRSVGPPRTSLMDDLCFYWKHHGSGVVDPSVDSILPVTVFLQKIVASNYMILIGYLESCLNELELAVRLAHVSKGAKNMTLQISEQWFILQSWCHRFPEYCGMLDDIRQLHAKLPRPSCPPGTTAPRPQVWDGCVEDFEAISAKMDALRRRTEVLADSFVGLASMAGMQESLDEARNVQILTFLGIFFLPLSWIASIFAIDDRPHPTGFPLYCKTAFPVAVGLTLIVALYIFSWRPVIKWLRKFKDQALSLVTLKGVS